MPGKLRNSVMTAQALTSRESGFESGRAVATGPAPAGDPAVQISRNQEPKLKSPLRQDAGYCCSADVAGDTLGNLSGLLVSMTERDPSLLFRPVYSSDHATFVSKCPLGFNDGQVLWLLRNTWPCNLILRIVAGNFEWNGS